MEVKHKKSIYDKVLLAANEALRTHKVIDEIVLTLEECAQLRREFNSYLVFQPVAPKTSVSNGPGSLIDIGRKITKGDWCTLMGIKLVAGESFMDAVAAHYSAKFDTKPEKAPEPEVQYTWEGITVSKEAWDKLLGHPVFRTYAPNPHLKDAITVARNARCVGCCSLVYTGCRSGCPYEYSLTRDKIGCKTGRITGGF